MITWPWQWRKRTFDAETAYSELQGTLVNAIHERDRAIEKNEDAQRRILQLQTQIRRMSER